MLALLSLVSIPPMIKRLHDRAKAGHWAFIYLAVAFAPMAIVSLIGPATFLISEFLWKVVIGLNVLSLLAILIIGIEFGLLRGTKGPNSYGPEPTHFATLRKM